MTRHRCVALLLVPAFGPSPLLYPNPTMKHTDVKRTGLRETIERALKPTPSKPSSYPGLDLELKLLLGHVVVGLLHLCLLVR